ncbi:hypothetical protein VIGAN_05200200, partial [Vigna angularis var. angularis]
PSQASSGQQPLAQPAVGNHATEPNATLNRAPENKLIHANRSTIASFIERNSLHTIVSSPLLNQAFVHPQFMNPNSRDTVSKSLLVIFLLK